MSNRLVEGQSMRLVLAVGTLVDFLDSEMISLQNHPHTQGSGIPCTVRCPTMPALTLDHTNVDGMQDCCCYKCWGRPVRVLRTWDLCAPACLYKLSSGNTEVVEDLSYSTDTKTLFATAPGSNTDRYFPDGYFSHDWNAYTQRGLIAFQHRTECSNVITYQFKEEVDVNENMPISWARREDPNE
eukprot:scaffold31667_cov62-Attheya_sp.AAC.1